jgi:hypothetical protein
MSKFALFQKKDIKRVEKKVDDFLGSLPPIKKRRLTRNIIKSMKIFIVFLVIVIVFLVLFIGYNYIIFKDIYGEALEGKKYLESSVYSVKEQDFVSAQDSSKKAQVSFEKIKQELNYIRNKYYLSNLSGIDSQLNDLDYLVVTGEIISRSIYQGSKMGSELNAIINSKPDFSFSKFSEEEKKRMLQFLFESGPEFYGIKANIDLAILNLNRFNGNGFLSLINGKVDKLKEQLNYGSLLLSKVVPLTEILPYVAGYPGQSNFLIVFQNSDELRPTGGFIGTYGVMENKNGEIVNFDTHDVYHMDMPIRDKLDIKPPAPIKEHMVDKWYMRDSNWSPDWPTSAQNIEWFYNQEYNLLPPKDKVNQFGGDFHGVIGITPKFVTGLLDIIGPIIVEGEEYNSENFHKLLQRRVEQKYVELGVSDWERKDVIGDILKILKTKFFDLPANRWGETLSIIENSFIGKDILLYFNDERLQDYIKFLNWNGEIVESDSDYLMVVDANLGSFKTDAVVKKKIEYKLEHNDKNLFSILNLNYAHQGGFDWRTTRYRSYTRVYVPEGTKFVKIDGDYQGEVDIGKELGKTYFGFFISVEPGNIGSVSIKYILPNIIYDDMKKYNKYSIYIQKQPGSKVEELLVDLNTINKVKSYKPVGFSVENNKNKEIIWKTDLKADRIFQINF